MFLGPLPEDKLPKDAAPGACEGGGMGVERRVKGLGVVVISSPTK
jgi:hypothetical protein